MPRKNPRDPFADQINFPMRGADKLPAKSGIGRPLVNLFTTDEYQGLTHFIYHNLASAPSDYCNFDGVWRRWIWYARTSQKTVGHFPGYLPSSKQALAKVLKQLFKLKTIRIRKSLRRGDYVDGQLNKVITVMPDVRILPADEAYWPGCKDPWQPLPWIESHTTNPKFVATKLGNAQAGVDPIGKLVMESRAEMARIRKEAEENPSLTPHQVNASIQKAMYQHRQRLCQITELDHQQRQHLLLDKNHPAAYSGLIFPCGLIPMPDVE